MYLIFIICGAACLIYYAVLLFYVGSVMDFAFSWLLLGGCLLISGWIFSRQADLHSRFGIFRVILATCWLAAFLAGLWEGGRILYAMRQPVPEKLDYILVLGAQVKGTVPSRSLSYRLEEALAAAQDWPEAKLILSGGQGEGEQITEAACMKNYLLAHGVPAGRLILEENSTSTMENLRFSDALTGCSKASCGIISNDFHLCRCLLLARKNNYTYVCGIPARSDKVIFLHCTLREIAALAALAL